MTSSGIQPAMIGGYGRQIKTGELDPSREGLVGHEFSSRSPPDIQPNTRIVAICGVTDFPVRGNHEPSSDEDDEIQPPVGAHPIRSTPKTGSAAIASKAMNLFSAKKRKERKEEKKAQKKAVASEGHASPKEDGANQRWITCESPKHLVDKYGEYGHGGPKTDHRVVLDKNMLRQIQNDKNMRVFTRAELLEDFLRTFKEECRLAAGLGQPLLLMIFGHGDPNTYGVAIGGAGEPRLAPRLKISQIATCLRGLDLSLTLLLTSCHPGGWLFQPELNISAFTTAGPLTKSRAWDTSLGGRSHGSFYATAVREAFIKMEDEKATQIHPHRPRELLDEEASSATYAELTNVIHSTLLYEIDPEFAPDDDVQFSAQDDKWELEGRKRSGVPLAEFQAQWDKLPRLAPQSTAALFRKKTGGIAGLSLSTTELEDRRRTYVLHRKFSEPQASKIVKDMSFGYLTSFPPPSNTGPDRRVHRLVSRLLEDEEMAPEEINELRGYLTYHLESIKATLKYKNIIVLGMVLVGKWLEEEARSGLNTYIIDGTDLFSKPIADEGWEFTKPYEYLAAACVECGLDEETVKMAVLKVLAEKNARVQALTKRVRKDRTVRRVGSKIFSTLGKRMRSASPPRGRAPLPSFGEIVG